MARNLAAALQLAMLSLVTFQSPLLGFCLCTQQPFIGSCATTCHGNTNASADAQATGCCAAPCHVRAATSCSATGAAASPAAAIRPSSCCVFFAVDSDPYAWAPPGEPAPLPSSTLSPPPHTAHPALVGAPPALPPGTGLSWSALGVGQPPPPQPSLLDLYAVLRL